MTTITRFEIKKLHGYKDIDVRFQDNTLILVGENGAGKTTVLRLFYYLLSGQWSLIARYQFEELAITVGNKRHVLQYSALAKPLSNIDSRLFHRLPHDIRHRVLALLEKSDGQLFSPELEMLCDRFGIPLHHLIRDLDIFEHTAGKEAHNLRQILDGITKSFKAQLLYLPTYRRIEQELNFIFQGFNERELRTRRELVATKRNGDTFVELIEFGMKDVDDDIKRVLSELSSFARESLNNLTFGYLGDIVERQYSAVNLDDIKNASDQTIANILNRIQDHILSAKNKQHLREKINQVKTGSKQTEHAQVICHYFTKLMAFQKQLEEKESQIRSFCDVCNEYMVDKEFKYDTTNFTCIIGPKKSIGETNQILLHQLSSGEKQIVSLFSHLYLSGGKSYFVLIDEPELSLSVPWQRRFLRDIRSADFCCGLVAVTHSPFIYDNELRKYAHGLGEFVL